MEAPERLPRARGASSKYFNAPGAGWEPLLRYGQTTIQDKVLYGTGAFLLGARPAELVSEFQALPVKREIMQKWCWKNAATLFGDHACRRLATQLTPRVSRR